MKKKTNLESGFLFLYDWMPVLELLPAKEVKNLLLALIARQRENKPLPHFQNTLTDSLARMIEPVIRRRLEGAAWAKKGADEAVHPQGDPTEVPHPQRGEEHTEQKSKEQSIKEEKERATPPQGEALPAFDMLRTLSEQEKEVLLSEGLPAAYIEERAERALAFAAKSGRTAAEILWAWWQKDKPTRVPYRQASTTEQRPQSGSFDTDDFFAAAVAETYKRAAKTSISPETG